MKVALALSALVAASSAAYFTEEFGEGWEDRWTAASKDDLGKFVASAGEHFNDADADVGIKTSEDAKFYGLAAKFESFSNEGKKLIVQFRVKHEQNIDCGGGYVKLFPSTQDVTGISDGDEKAPYNIMFGPDICGPGTRKVHVIFNYKGENKLTKSSITCKSDEASHLYTLIVSPDNTYEVQIDGEKEHSGSIYDDFDMLKAKEINDPEVSKPDDWVDETMIDDPEDVKPDDWVTEKQIVDPEAEQPEDWDEEMDGEWEAPTIDNPEFKGEFKAKRIDNPEYKGVWVHDQVPNPDYVDDKELYAFEDFGAIGIDIWQVKSGSVFDDILISDDVADAEAAVAAFEEVVAAETAAKEAADAAKKAEEEAAAAAAEEEAENAPEEADEADEAEEPAAEEETKDEL
jgi:calreticulin